MRFEGIASTTAPDREGEQMTRRALDRMAQAGPVALRAGHRGGERIGTVEQVRREGERLRVRGRLDESNPRARALWERLCQGVRMALSVGGRKRVVRRYSPVAGRWVRVIEDAGLEHVAVCRPGEARNAEAEIVASRESRVASGEGEGRVESRKSEVESEEAGGARREARGARGLETPQHTGEETWPPVPLSAQIRAVREKVGQLEESLEERTHASPPGPLSRACGWGEGAGGEVPVAVSQLPRVPTEASCGPLPACGEGRVGSFCGGSTPLSPPASGGKPAPTSQGQPGWDWGTATPTPPSPAGRGGQGGEASVSPPPSREGGQGGRSGGEAPATGDCTPGRRQSLPVVKAGRRSKRGPATTQAGKPALPGIGETPMPPGGLEARPTRNDDLWKGVL